MKEIIIGLLCVMIANILLGATLAKFKENFKWNTLFKGIFKAVCVSLGVGLMYYCGYLNPNILAVNINGTDMNLIDGLRLVFIAGIVYYGYGDLTKLKDILKLDMNITKSINSEEDIEEIEV